MRIFITGIAGFIGSNLADKLISLGHEVSGIDNFLTGRQDNIPKEAEWYYRSITDPNPMMGFQDADIVIHCAASYKNPDDWETDIETNVLGTANIVRACIKYNVKKLIYFQTSLCYGVPREVPISLDHPLNPNTSYAITKTAAERFIFMSGLPYVSFRLANMYGPRNLSGPVPTFYMKIKNGEKCTIMDTRRDFFFIDDLVKIVVQAVDGEHLGVYHISSGMDYSIKELFDGMVRLTGPAEFEMREKGEDDVPTIMLDNSKTKQDFGFFEMTLMDDGLGAAVEWYNTHEFNETFTHLRGVK